MLGQIIALGFLALFLGLLVAGAVADLRAFVIPNWISGGLAVLAMAWLLSDPAGRFVPGVIAGLLVLVVGLGLYGLRVWGGGDAKLLAAAAMWVGIDALPRLLLVVALAGGGLAMIALLRRAVWRWRNASSEPASNVAYGVAIAAGGVDWVLSEVATRVELMGGVASLLNHHAVS